MNSIKHLTLIASVVFNLSLYSQFQEGYIISNNNDTIFGNIENEGSVENSYHCSFKLNDNDEVTKYYPGDLKAFRFIDGKYFISSEIIIGEKPQKVFLEWLINGKASILTYTPSLNNSRYFILLENDSLFELKNTKITRNVKGYNYEFDSKEYISSLTYYLRDCPSIFPYIESTSFNRNDLVKLAKKYHDKTCSDEECIIYENSRKLNFNVTLFVAYLKSQLQLNNSIPENVYLTGNYGLGITLDIFDFPVVSPNLSLKISLLNYSSLYSYNAEELYWADDEKLFKISTCRIPFQITYKFLHKKLKPFVSIGFTTNVRYKYTEYNKLLVNYVTEHYDYTLGMKLIQLGFNTGAGLEYIINPRFGINCEFNYEMAHNFFGAFVGDTSFVKNYFVQTGLFVRLGKS